MKNKKLIIIIASVILAVIVTLGVSAPYIMDCFGINKQDKEVSLEILPADFLNEISAKLEDTGVIKSEKSFNFYMFLFHSNYKFLNGKYELNTNMSYGEIIKAFDNPVELYQTVKIAIPEGKTAAQIGDILQENNICSKDSFINAMGEKYNFPYLDSINTMDNPYILEGYLFPATYSFTENSDPKEVIQKMLDTFTNYVTSDIATKAKEKNLSVSQLITFASVVQAEGLGEESMKNISSVFWNRLASKDLTKLQSDPTIKYANTLKEFNVSQDTLDSYNTYKCTGLPVAPINSPGMQAINAVLNANETDYYYFISDVDKNFYYAKTYEEHLVLCRKYGLL